MTSDTPALAPALARVSLAAHRVRDVLPLATDLAELGMVGITVPLSGGTAMLERSAARSDAVVLVEADEASIATLLHTIQRVRRAAPRAVLLVLSDGIDEERTVAALQAGGDDCLSRSTSARLLAARLAHFARPRAAAEPPRDEVLRFANVTCNVTQRRVTRRDAEVDLSPIEFDLLVALARRRGRLASRRELLAEVWGIVEETDSRCAAQAISTLRRKLADHPMRPTLIKTIHKHGYRLLPPVTSTVGSVTTVSATTSAPPECEVEEGLERAS